MDLNSMDSNGLSNDFSNDIPNNVANGLSNDLPNGISDDIYMSESEDEMEITIPEIKGQFIPPNERGDAPLAGILNPEYQSVDPRLLFPDYTPDGILRFSKMFGINPKALSQNMIWWPSKTFYKKPEQQNQRSEQEKSEEFRLNIGPNVKKEQCVTDQTELLLKSKAELEALKSLQADEDDEPPAWRFGPAQMWYDRLGLPEKPQTFNYGFKTNRFNIITSTSKKPVTNHVPTNEELLPVNLLHWEDDIIYGSENDCQIQPNIGVSQPKCGWISTQQTRTYQAYKTAFSSSSEEIFNGPDATHSIFPTDNYDLENTRWEDDVILDPDNMSAIPKPHILTIQYEDDPTIFGIPEDISFEEKCKDDGRNIDRKDHQFTKKSKMILSQVQRRHKQEEEENMEHQTAQSADKDVFNMSNDEYYAPKNTHRAIGSGSAIQHAIPAQNIHRAFFPTHMDIYNLRHLHRLPCSKKVIRHFIDREISIHNSLKFIASAEDRRKHQVTMESGSEIFHMRSLKDLSARDGTLVCIEYSEEHPPLLSQPGMASKIRNYHQRKAQKEIEKKFEFGETAFTMNSPFLGDLNHGQSLQAIENNMYRAPIFQHKSPSADFILIRCADGLFVRECPAVFSAGQECPLYEIPSPNSKKATVFGRDCLLAFIYRLFWESEHQPRRLRMEDIREAFPDYAESSVRKRLKQCSDYTRSVAGPDQNYWAIKEEFRLPSKEEVLGMLTPEMCCAHYSMQSAEQRLKDAGYGEKYWLTPENDEDSDDQVTIEDEIKCAPWNTTRAYISASKGKCLLDQTGVADPTGCGQGFSYVRVTQKPQKEDVPQMPKRLVTGTNADLRKLPLKEAKDICRSYGIKEEEISELTRWEIIDVIRTLSTQAAKAKADFTGMGRFARGNIRLTSADAQDSYKKYCQHVFNLQNEVLASNEQVSTDEGSENEDSDNDMASKLEKMLDNEKNPQKGRGKMTSRKFDEFEDEEKDRLALQRMIHGDVAVEKMSDKKKVNKDDTSIQFLPNESNVIRKLYIHRVYKDADGTESERLEIIPNQQVIDGYDKVRKTKDVEFIKVYSAMDDQYKEERRKEKRRLQDQLRRIKRKEQKDKTGAAIGRPRKHPVDKKPPPVKESLLKMKCSACGETGHMKTNKHCKLYGQRLERRRQKTVGDVCKGSTSSIALENMSLKSGELMAMEGTKLRVSQKFFAGSQEKKALKLRIPTDLINQQKMASTSDDDKSARLNNPLKLENIESDMDDSLFSTNLRHEMHSPASTIGSNTARTPMTGKSSFYGRRRGTVDEEYLLGPIKSVHRRRADPRVSMATILLEILDELKTIPDSQYFSQPVSKKIASDYHNIVTNPMDLQTIRTNIMANKYELRTQFMEDLKLILGNSQIYNGKVHPITSGATQLVEVALLRIQDKEVRLIELEKQINPILDSNDLVGLHYILGDIVQNCKNLKKSALFHTRVDIKKYPTYYDKVERPMDLGTIEQKVKEHQYRTIESFLADMEQIYKNSLIFNGEIHVFTVKAKEIFEKAKEGLEEKNMELQFLQSRIEAPSADNETQSVDYNTMDEENDEMTQDTFGPIDDQETQQDAEGFSEILPTDDETTMDAWENSNASGLVGSQMQMAGQLNADLELTDSDSDNEVLPDNKRPRLDDDLEEL